MPLHASTGEPPPGPEARGPGWTRVGAPLALLLAAVFHLFSIFLAPLGATAGTAAAPWTDGAEYLDAAVSLTREGRFAIHLAGESHPPRYPFGFSLLTATALAMGVEPLLAPHRVNQAASLALIALVAAFVWKRVGRLEGSLTALLVATLPAFVVLARSPLSEVTGTLPVVGGAWLLYEYAKGGSLGKAGIGAALLALGVSFRTSNLLLLGFLPAAALGRHGLRPARVGRDLLRLAGAAAAGLLPALIYNTLTFGGPLRTGYGYWIPSRSALSAFQLQFVMPNLGYAWRELTQRESLFTTADLYGAGSYVGPGFVLLTAVAVFQRRSDRVFRWFLLAGVANTLVLTAYFVSDARLLFPLLVLAAPVAAVGLVRGLRLCWPRSRALALGLAGLLVSAVLGWPARGGRPELLALARPTRKPSTAYDVTRQFQRLHGKSPRLLLTDMPPPYLHAALPPGAVVAPLLDDHLFRFSPGVFEFGAPARQRLVSIALASGKSVWVVAHDHDVLDLDESLSPPAGYAWEVVAHDERSGGIARLVPQ